MVGSPPGLPGGRITGVLPASGVGARISGSMPAGGHSTPSDFARVSPSDSVRCPVVVPSGTTMPRGGTGFIGVQCSAGGAGAVWAIGVTRVGGACALATTAGAIRIHESKIARFIIRENGQPAPGFRTNR
jgi:hypothetical protein